MMSHIIPRIGSQKKLYLEGKRKGIRGKVMLALETILLSLWKWETFVSMGVGGSSLTGFSHKIVTGGVTLAVTVGH